MRRVSSGFWMLLLITLSACGALRGPEPEAESLSQAATPHENLHSVLWVQTAVEYRAVAEQSYTLARLMLDRGLNDPNWTALLEQAEMDPNDYAGLPPAVIVDVDETVLDNSAYQARLVAQNETYDRASWQDWVREEQADAVPGALSFAKYAQRNGVTVLYVTNRRHEVEPATRRNLRQLGFPLSEERDVILTRGEQPGWDGSKTPRREMLAEDFRVLLLIGDNFGDFAPDVEQSVDARRRLARQYTDYWGTRWIVLPNPQYGSWEGALYDFEYDLPSGEQLRRKYEQLETKQETVED